MGGVDKKGSTPTRLSSCGEDSVPLSIAYLAHSQCYIYTHTHTHIYTHTYTHIHAEGITKHLYVHMLIKKNPSKQ